MREKIIQITKDLENEYDIRTLFCVESGSRLWGMDSIDSDYDVRFVFVRPFKDYIRLSSPPDMISRHYDQEGRSCEAKGCYIDVCGFDILKFGRMLYASKPNAMEWLQSDIVYYGEKPKPFMEFAEKHFNPVSYYHHYKSMCRQNYLKYLESGKEVTYKKYLYAMRGLVNAKWMAHNHVLAPIKFEDTINSIPDGLIPHLILDRLKEIIQLKKDQKEKEIVQNQSAIDAYIESFLADDSDCPKPIVRISPIGLDEEIKRQIMLDCSPTQK